MFAYLYGSQATGATHPFSDADISVFLAQHPMDRVIHLESDIALAFDLALKHQIQTDVRALNDSPLVLKGEILTEGILLYSCDEEARVAFETRVRMAYFEFRPIIKAYQDAYVSRVMGT